MYFLQKLQKAWHTFLPTACIFCQTQQTTPMCNVCLDRLAAIKVKRCSCCALALDVNHAWYAQTHQSCPDCAHTNFAFDQTQVLYDYAAFTKSAVYAIKQGDTALLKQWARLFAKKLGDAIDAGECKTPAWITCVPIQNKAWYARGYHQTKMIAKIIAADLALPFIDAFAYHPDYKVLISQKKQNRAQRHLANEQEKFIFSKKMKQLMSSSAPLIQSTESIAIVDDVMTTGATLHQLAKFYKNMNQQLTQNIQNIHIQAWVLARTTVYA